MLIGFSACSSNSHSQDAPAETTAGTPAEEQPVAVSSDKGVGPISSIEVGPGIDQDLADKGKEIFESKCGACHKLDQRYVGPALAGVTKRRKPEWIMNMILNPAEMVQKDDTAKALLGTFMTQMPNQNLSEEEARAVLEYFRAQDEATQK